MAFDAGDIETTLELDRTPFNQGLDKAEKDARAFERKKFKSKIDVEIDQRQVDRDINRSTAGKKPKVEIEVDIDQAKVAKKIDEIADNTEKTASRSGNRFARALLNPVMIQLGLLPGIAAIAAAGAGAAMLLPVIAFGALGIMAVKNTAEVKDAWADLKKEVTTGSKEMAGPMKLALVDTMNEARVVWAAAKPMIGGMFADAAPNVRSFAGSLMGMVVNTLPGMNVALQRGEGFMRGWDTALGMIGTGLSDLVDNATRVGDAEQAMSNFGRTVQLLLGFVGNLVAIFSDAWAVIGGPFNGALEQLLGLAKDFATGALPAMSGGLTVLLGILSAVMSVLGPVMNFLGSGVGTILAAAAAYKLLSAAMTGIGRAGTAVKSAVTGTVTSISGAAAGMTILGGNAKTTAQDVDKSGESVGRFAKAASATGKVLSTVGNSLPIIGAAFAIFGGVVSAVEDDIQKKIAERNKKWDEQRDKAERAADKIRTSQDQVQASQLQYNKAVYDMGPASDRAQAAQERLAQATLREKDAQNDAARATKTHTERLLDFFDTLSGGISKQVAYNNTVKDVKEKQEALAESIKKTGKNSMDTKFATDDLQLAMANQVKAAGDLAIAQNSTKTESDKLALAQRAVALEAVKMIDIFGARAPAALYQTLAAMSDTELAAIGGKRSFDAMGNAIILVPGYKPIRIDSNMVKAAEEALALKNRVNEIPTGTRYFDYIINTVVKGPGPGTAPFPIPMGNAYGTSNWGGGWSLKDEHGPEFIQLPGGSKVFTNNRSRGMVHDEVRRAMAEFGGMGGGDTYNNTFNPPPLADEAWLDRVTAEISRRQSVKIYQGR
jgi:hypothetical protein